MIFYYQSKVLFYHKFFSARLQLVAFSALAKIVAGGSDAQKRAVVDAEAVPNLIGLLTRAAKSSSASVASDINSGFGKALPLICWTLAKLAGRCLQFPYEAKFAVFLKIQKKLR